MQSGTIDVSIWNQFLLVVGQIASIVWTWSGYVVTQAYHAVLVNVVLVVFNAVGLNTSSLERFQRALSDVLSYIFTAPHRTANGQTFPYSLANVMDTRYQLHPDYVVRLRHEFPWFADDGAACKVDHPETVHVLSLMSKLAYEDPQVVNDIAQKWGLQVYNVSTDSASAFVAVVGQSVVVAFQGTTAKTIVSVLEGVTLELPDKQGTIYASFYRDLLSTDSDGRTMLEMIEEIVVRPGLVDKQVLITGHSLGASMGVLFGVLCDARIQKRIAGFVTFGQPREGDETFRLNFERMHPGKYVRYVHAFDLVTYAPVLAAVFRHIDPKRYITVAGDVKSHEDEIATWTVVDALSYWVQYLALIPTFWLRGESLLRSLFRVAFLGVPNGDDHWICNYERALYNRVTNVHELKTA